MPALLNPYRAPGVVTYPSTVLADTPLGYWRLGESSGNALDSSGNGRDGTITGIVSRPVTGLLTGDADTAYQWNGSSGRYIDLGNLAAWDVAAVSVEAWILTTTATGSPNIVGRDTGGAGSRAFQFRLNLGKPEFLVFVGGAAFTAAGATGVATGTKHHLVGTYDGANVRIYVDGSQVGITAKVGSMDNGDNAYIAARTPTQNPWNNTIDEVAYYGTALSAARVLAHYNAGV